MGLGKLIADRLNSISKTAEFYDFEVSAEKIGRKAIFLTGGGPIPLEEPMNIKENFYFVLRAIIPIKAFSWAEEYQ